MAIKRSAPRKKSATFSKKTAPKKKAAPKKRNGGGWSGKKRTGPQAGPGPGH